LNFADFFSFIPVTRRLFDPFARNNTRENSFAHRVVKLCNYQLMLLLVRYVKPF